MQPGVLLSTRAQSFERSPPAKILDGDAVEGPQPWFRMPSPTPGTTQLDGEAQSPRSRGDHSQGGYRGAGCGIAPCACRNARRRRCPDLSRGATNRRADKPPDPSRRAQGPRDGAWHDREDHDRSCHESGAVEVDVHGAFAGVMQAAGLVERYALRTKKAPEGGTSGAVLSVVAGAGFEPAAFRL